MIINPNQNISEVGDSSTVVKKSGNEPASKRPRSKGRLFCCNISLIRFLMIRILVWGCLSAAFIKDGRKCASAKSNLAHLCLYHFRFEQSTSSSINHAVLLLNVFLSLGALVLVTL